MSRNRSNKRERELDNELAKAAQSMQKALMLYRRAPGNTRFSHFSRQMMFAIRQDFEYLERTMKAQRPEMVRMERVPFDYNHVPDDWEYRVL